MMGWSSIIISLFLHDNELLLSDLKIISFVICLILTLVPSKLFDFRYLSLGYIILLAILHRDYPNWKDLYYFIFNNYNLIWIIIVNIITLYVFIKLPFANSYFALSETSRFMW